MTLCEAVFITLRRLHPSPRTEESYLRWVRAFVRFHHRRHPREMGTAEITAFLNDLAVRWRVSASTQNRALCALVFLYRKVLELPLPALDGLQRAQRPESLPTVLPRRDVLALLDRLESGHASKVAPTSPPPIPLSVRPSQTRALPERGSQGSVAGALANCRATGAARQ